MWISKLQVVNLRGFEDTGTIKLARGLNVIVGPNNAGKSTLLRALQRLQHSDAFNKTDVRKGSAQAWVKIQLAGVTDDFRLAGLSMQDFNVLPEFEQPYLQIIHGNADTQATMQAHVHPNTVMDLSVITSVEPNNFIYPFSAKRKVNSYTEDVRLSISESVQDTLSNLVARIDRLLEHTHPNHDEFVEACLDVIGFRIATFPSQGGKQAGLVVGDLDHIPLEGMGEGIGHILGLISSMCVARHRLFLIEEIENDIHPQALKELLKLIISKSVDNQFVISTHSNIVTKHLGSEPGAKVFAVNMQIQDRVPRSVVREIQTPVKRRELLEDLGYEFNDFDLWKGWLFLEESSAETIVREYLFPWFTPGIARTVRTIACGGVSKVGPKFEDFDRLFLFTHLESMYRNRAWVIVDGDDVGKDTVQKLKNRYRPPDWTPDRFRSLGEEDFERYYPPHFATEVERVLAIPNKQEKREAKLVLLKDVESWITINEQIAKAEFETSASEVIEMLREIELQIA